MRWWKVRFFYPLRWQQLLIPVIPPLDWRRWQLTRHRQWNLWSKNDDKKILIKSPSNVFWDKHIDWFAKKAESQRFVKGRQRIKLMFRLRSSTSLHKFNLLVLYLTSTKSKANEYKTCAARLMWPSHIYTRVWKRCAESKNFLWNMHKCSAELCWRDEYLYFLFQADFLLFCVIHHRQYRSSSLSS